jgi:hypothetical protein
MDATPLTSGDGRTSWCIVPEWGFPDSLVLWLWIDGWCFPFRIQAGTMPPLLLQHAPGFVPDPLPVIVA